LHLRFPTSLSDNKEDKAWGFREKKEEIS